VNLSHLRPKDATGCLIKVAFSRPSEAKCPTDSSLWKRERSMKRGLRIVSLIISGRRGQELSGVKF